MEAASVMRAQGKRNLTLVVSDPPQSPFDPAKPTQFFYIDELTSTPLIHKPGLPVSLESAMAVYITTLRRSLITTMNRVAKIIGLDDFELSTDVGMDKLPRQVQVFLEERVNTYMATGKIEPLLWETQIEAVIKVLKLLRSGKTKILIEAFTQSGKSGILLLAAMMWQVYCHAKGRSEKCYNISPNSNSISDQTAKDANQIMSVLYGLMFDGHSDSHLAALDYETHNEFGNKKSVSKKFDRFAEQLDERIKAGRHSVLFIDEADEANNRNSYLDKLLKTRMHSGKISVVLLTATAYGFADAEEFERVTVETGPNYRGMFPIPGRKMVPILSFDHLDHAFGMYQFADWGSVTKERKLRAMDELIPAVRKGLRRAITNTQYLPDTIDMPTGEINGEPWQGGSGMIVRFSKSKSDCEDFAVHLETRNRSYMRGVTVLKFWGSYMNSQHVRIPGQRNPVKIEYNTIDTMVKAAEAHGMTNYVIIVAGGARRGDRVPESCTIAVELTKEQSGAIARLQGLAGRMTGHKDTPTIFICSTRDHGEIEGLRYDYRRNGTKVGSGKIGARLSTAWSYEINGVRYDEFSNPLKNKKVIRVDRADYPQFEPLFRRIDATIGTSINWRERKFTEKQLREMAKSLRLLDARGKPDPARISRDDRYFPSPKLERDLAQAQIAAGQVSCIAEAVKTVDANGKPDYADFLFWDLFGDQRGLLTEEFMEVIRFRAGQPILMPRVEQTGGGRMLKTPVRGVSAPHHRDYVQVTVGNYDSQAKLGVGRRAVTGNRAQRALDARSTRTADKNPNDLNLDILFEPVGTPVANAHGDFPAGAFRCRLITIPLQMCRDEDELVHGQKTRDARVYANANTHVHDNLYEAGKSQAIVQGIASSKATKNPRRARAKPPVVKPTAPIIPSSWENI